MASSDVMCLRAGNFLGGLIAFRGGFFSVETMLARARDLTQQALVAKAGGDRQKAVSLYRELIPYLDKLDDLGVFSFPKGLQAQIVQRAIEQLEECDQAAPP